MQWMFSLGIKLSFIREKHWFKNCPKWSCYVFDFPKRNLFEEEDEEETNLTYVVLKEFFLLIEWRVAVISSCQHNSDNSWTLNLRQSPSAVQFIFCNEAFSLRKDLYSSFYEGDSPTLYHPKVPKSTENTINNDISNHSRHWKNRWVVKYGSGKSLDQSFKSHEFDSRSRLDSTKIVATNLGMIAF